MATVPCSSSFRALPGFPSLGPVMLHSACLDSHAWQGGVVFTCCLVLYLPNGKSETKVTVDGGVGPREDWPPIVIAGQEAERHEAPALAARLLTPKPPDPERFVQELYRLHHQISRLIAGRSYRIGDEVIEELQA
jgi:hypothetical protein